jgi:hypothetical protein
MKEEYAEQRETAQPIERGHVTKGDALRDEQGGAILELT